MWLELELELRFGGNLLKLRSNTNGGLVLRGYLVVLDVDAAEKSACRPALAATQAFFRVIFHVRISQRL